MSQQRVSQKMESLAWQNFENLLDSAHAIVPVGAVESHGPHLPLTTDTIISEYFSARIAEQIPAYILPPVSYGVFTPPFRLGGDFLGVFDVSGSTFTALVEDLLSSIYGHGTRDVIIVNSAFGNISFLCAAAQQHHNRHPDARVMIVGWWDVVGEAFRNALAEETGVERRDDHHAAMVESSLLMHIAPELVHYDQFTNASGPESGNGPRRISYHMLPLPADCSTDTGIVYRADMATADIGARVCTQVTKNLVDAIHREFGERGATE